MHEHLALLVTQADGVSSLYIDYCRREKDNEDVVKKCVSRCGVVSGV